MDFKTAARKGEPFADMMEALAEYRATKGEPQVSPWARGRLCTAYMKQKVQEHYIASLGIESYDSLVGLRFDEPDRVHKLKERDTEDKVFRCPLSEARIAKPDVMEFWSRQPFDLRIAENEGNCIGCFLKDQTDLARVMAQPNADLPWWDAIENRYPMFGGKNFAGYQRLASERAQRLAIESALRAGAEPVSDGSMDKRRFRLVVIQERKRIKGEVASFSCACEASYDPLDL